MLMNLLALFVSCVGFTKNNVESQCLQCTFQGKSHTV